MALTAEVAISGATLTYDKLYTYLVPVHMAGHIFVGSMVLAPFGRGSARPRTGVVLSLQEAPDPDKRVKPLAAVAPEEARLTPELLAIVRYLKEATFCTWYDAVRAVIPYGAQYKPVQLDGGWALQKALRRHTETVYSLAPLQQEAPAVEAGDEAPIKPEQAASAPKRPRLTAKGQQVLQYLQDGPKTRTEILKHCDVGRGVADTLVKNGYLVAEERDMVLGDIGGMPETEIPLVEAALPLHPADLQMPRRENDIPPLSEAQQQVANTLLARMKEQKPKSALLYGVTGSGKTAVFLTLIDRVLKAGKTALVLVPEIGLTPQMVTGLRAAFGSRVAVQHSALSNTERLLQWRQVQRGEASVVVGTRSAVFAPLENLGIVVIDEQHERTYQSESTPRYDAIEVARRRANHHGALLLMASATPSVADYYAAEQGRYELLKLTERYGSLPLPSVEIVDMRNEQALGNVGSISSRLAAGIAKNLATGKQTILLLNRRGYNRVGLCRDCGEALKCGSLASAGQQGPHAPVGCSVPMVYHKAGNRLVCHYCGYTVSPPPEKCPTCGGDIRYTGFGTQRLEEELAEKFPTARVLRMDLDSTAKKGAHADMLARFATGEYDILLGTQMVAKGLDFEKVSLVGVIGIDSLLFSQGYRSFETVYSLVTQVVGRSGRAGSPGRAMIQTADPENPVLNLAARQDYDAFYRQEIAFRKLALYPPFCTICVCTFVAGEEALALRAALSFSTTLQRLAKPRGDIPLRILGPAPMSVAQVAGSYRYRLTLKCRNDASFRALAMQALEIYNKDGWMRNVPVAIDMHADGGV